jgi:hypothetical protein
LLTPARARAVTDGNLIEYSFGGFAEGDVMLMPMLLPPVVKIYADGRVVFRDDPGFLQGQLPPERLERLKRRLSGNALLKATRLVPVKKGGAAGFHGGMAYIRYRDGADEVVIGALCLPHSGPWARLVREIRSFIPTAYWRFVPAAASVSVHTGGTWGEPTPWPFSAKLPLSKLAQAETAIPVDDRSVIAFLFGHFDSGFSWLDMRALEGGKGYSIKLDSVPGWYEPSDLSSLLGSLAYDAERFKEE